MTHRIRSAPPCALAFLVLALSACETRPRAAPGSDVVPDLEAGDPQPEPLNPPSGPAVLDTPTIAPDSAG